jgi:hypothetical protein
MQQALARQLSPSKLQDLNLKLETDPPSPMQVREWVSDLFRNNHTSLAVALAEAGLALYPDSEDVLVIAALVSEVQQDWPRSLELLEHLVKVQAGNTPPEVWVHLIRVTNCLNSFGRAHEVAMRALQMHPNNTALLQQLEAIRPSLSESLTTSS